jgi:uncharacterized protein YndB with AHSA1/START domain
MIHRVAISVPATTVYAALTSRDGIAGFWTVNADVPSSEGTEARFGFPEAPVDLRMRVATLRPAEQIVWHCEGDFPFWAGTTIAWRLAEVDGLTTLDFRHTGFADDYPDDEYGLVNFTWGQILGRLRGFAETGEAQPLYPVA